MIHEAEVFSEHSRNTVGYNQPIIELLDRRAYTTPISGDLIRIGLFIYVILHITNHYNHKFTCKVLCSSHQKTPEVISMLVLTS